jgi:hypothetical protein
MRPLLTRQEPSYQLVANDQNIEASLSFFDEGYQQYSITVPLHHEPLDPKWHYVILRFNDAADEATLINAYDVDDDGDIDEDDWVLKEYATIAIEPDYYMTAEGYWKVFFGTYNGIYDEFLIHAEVYEDDELQEWFINCRPEDP